MRRILYLTADPKELARVKRYWRADRDIELVTSGREAISAAREHPPDVMCVDLTSLEGDPERLLVRLRRAAPGQAVLLIVGGEEPTEELPKADAYIRKPFNKRIFRQRIAAALRIREKDVIVAGNFRLDRRTRTFYTPHGTCHLTPREQIIMTELMRHPGEITTRRTLVQAVWHTEYVEDMRALDVHIHLLRAKIEEDPRNPQHIRTVYRRGYLFDPGNLPSEGDDGDP